MKTLTYKLITAENLDEAAALQNEIFPQCDGYQNYVDAIQGTTQAEYYLAFLDEEPVGLFGIYQEDIEKETAWLQWFGIKKDYRRQHLGTGILLYFEYLAKQRGHLFARLYIDAERNEVAHGFFRKYEYQSEPYLREDDPQSSKTPVLIFSKSLCDQECPAWDNKDIHLSSQVEKEKSRKAK